MKSVSFHLQFLDRETGMRKPATMSDSISAGFLFLPLRFGLSSDDKPGMAATAQEGTARNPENRKSRTDANGFTVTQGKESLTI